MTSPAQSKLSHNSFSSVCHCRYLLRDVAGKMTLMPAHGHSGKAGGKSKRTNPKPRRRTSLIGRRRSITGGNKDHLKEGDTVQSLLSPAALALVQGSNGDQDTESLHLVDEMSLEIIQDSVKAMSHQCHHLRSDNYHALCVDLVKVIHIKRCLYTLCDMIFW